MSLDKVTARLRQQQEEVLSAMEARKGDKGKAYVEIVKEAARSCAVLSVVTTAMPAYREPILHATVCVITAGMMKILDLYKIPADAIDEALAAEFSSDLVNITRYMVHKCSEDDLKS